MTGQRYKVQRRMAVAALWLLAVCVPTAALALGDAKALAAYEAKSYREAMRLYRPLAEKGDVEAQYYLGRMYEKGEGVSKDEEQLAKWYRRSAEGGYAKAQYKVAVAHAFGLAGTPRSDDEAIKWLRRSAEGGYPRAQKMLGRAYAEGRFGLARDPKQAEYWTKKSEAPITTPKTEAR